MVIHSSDTSAIVAQKCADAIFDVFCSLRGTPLLFLYSGGSALSVLDRVAAYLSDYDLTQVIFAPVDERNDPAHSNVFAFMHSFGYFTFLRQGAVAPSLSLCVGSPSTVGEEYNQQIASLFVDIKARHGLILSLLGMGQDGHIAGIFPFADDCSTFDLLFGSCDYYAVGYDVGSRNQYRERITLTPYALRLVDFNFVYVCGSAKRDALLMATTDGPLCVCPARLLQQMRDVVVFTDIYL